MQEFKTPTTRLILPSAGFGTRVGAPYSSGKELMEDPVTKAPLIKYMLDLALWLKFPVTIISRPDKVEFNRYILSNYPSVELLIRSDLAGEWPDTILKSEAYWSDHNIVLLPDTRFSYPLATVKAISKQLFSRKLAFGIFDIKEEDSYKFAVLKGNKACEKPDIWGSKQAIGIFGFRKSVGKQLFSGFSSRKWFELDAEPGIIELEWFKDITRNGKVEEY